MKLDDSDMKIVGEPASASPAAYPEEELRQARENGNLDKARQLGSRLSQAIVASDGDEADRFLQTFAAVVGMDSVLPAGLTVETARSALYDGLQASGLYDALRQSGVFSFYYLCLQEHEVEQKVGQTFARLTGDPARAVAGEALYRSFLERVQREAADLQFC